MQQDRSSHACCGTALWCLAYYHHRRYNTPRYFPRQITEIASHNLELGTVASGLTPEQMARVLRHMGCAVHMKLVGNINKKNPEERKRILHAFRTVVYGYVQSNIPVLIGYWFKEHNIGHAVLAVGHDYVTERKPDILPDNGIILHSDYVSKFYVQDDQRGPYQPLEIWSDNSEGVPPNLPDAKVAEGKKHHCLADADTLLLLPGVTHAVRMTHGQAVDTITRLLKDEAINQIVQRLANNMRFRIYLQLRRRFQALTFDNQNGRRGLHWGHVKAYRTTHLPKYIYICDMCLPGNGADSDFRLAGEIILDATAPNFEHAAADEFLGYDADGNSPPTTAVLAMRFHTDLYIPPTAERPVSVGYDAMPLAPKNPPEIL